MSTAYAQQMAKYNREAVLSAPPARLLTMLYDRLLLDLDRAEAAQQGQNWAAASENLVHAQAIVAELSTSLNADAWDGADQLFALYTFASNTMIEANIQRDAGKTRDCIAVLEPLRQSWHEAAASLPVRTGAPAFTGGSLGIG
ncbi:flagellar export chaperone FliS [Paenarthrobacter sp. PH39-S1]|uniref:flagellar export chaperone FliS n=1 Tax=Paenarthrobacter sp. PH39-S1 TaxID=3046204 RepID=UPI0024BA00FB|nr:flagellar export chaperone FliS [Paenarthrobacter sp. PH39-S1]MDJ0355975.1 flagellar export chaperone FliS [Paenarthrobacter sp. PH39-S1]